MARSNLTQKNVHMTTHELKTNNYTQELLIINILMEMNDYNVFLAHSNYFRQTLTDMFPC